jgi:hypothetical protein
MADRHGARAFATPGQHQSSTIPKVSRLLDEACAEYTIDESHPQF